MSEDPSSSSQAHPLIKDVPGHLFTFEEKIFGMSLTHLLTDLGVLTSSVSFTGSLPLLPRVILCLLITLLGLLLVHGKVRGLSLGYWSSLLLRSKMIPTQTIWRSVDHDQTQQKKKKSLPSVQATWIPLDKLTHGIASKSRQWNKTEIVRYWMVFEIEGKNIGLLPEVEQLRVFQRFEAFLTGLSFHVQFLSATSPIDSHTAPAFLVQRQALETLRATPRLQALTHASLRAQQRHSRSSTQTRHFLIVSASSAEPALQNPEETPSSVLGSMLRAFSWKKASRLTREEVLKQLRIRASVVHQAIRQLDLQVFPLTDQAMLSLLAKSLAPGSVSPSFVPERISDQTVLLASSETPQDTARGFSATHGTCHHPMSQGSHPLPSSPSCPQGQHGYKKKMRGVHTTFSYTSPHPHALLETDRLAVADLLAPSSIRVLPDTLHIQAGPSSRYVRTITVTGYGHHLACGWFSRLHELGVPLLISAHLEPLDNRLMLLKLEQALTKLESQRLSDQEKLRLSKADQRIEAEQIRRVSHALAAKRLKIFDVSLVICLHAGSQERLEERSHYVLSHLREMQIQARSATLQQDLAWQSCLPTGLDLLQQWHKLTSDVVSTMLPATSVGCLNAGDRASGTWNCRRLCA